MLFRSTLLVLTLSGVDLLHAQQAPNGPAAFWRREFAAHRSLANRGHGTAVESKPALVEIVSDEPAALPAQPAAKPPFRERLTALRTQILSAEERLLFATGAEERALDYNASRRSELAKLKTDLSRRAGEHMEFLRELSSEYRAQADPSSRTQWMQDHRPLVVQEITQFLEQNRRGTALDTALVEIANTDQRLRQLIQKKQGDQRRYGRQRSDAPIEEVLRVELPVEVVTPTAPALSPEELRLFQELFPVR